VTTRTRTTKARPVRRIAALVWVAFALCLAVGSVGFASSAPSETLVSFDQAALSASPPSVSYAPTSSLSNSSLPSLAGSQAAPVFAQECVDGPSSDKTVFGRYYSCNGVPSQLAKVEPNRPSPPISCIDPFREKRGQSAELCFRKYADSPNQLLPAWRWRAHVGLYNNTPGLAGVVNTMFSFVASIFFLLAGLCWWVLLEITEWVLTDSLVQDAAEQMNRGFATVTDLLNASGVFLLLGALGLITFVRLFFRGRLIKALGLVLAFVIPVAAIQGLAVRASNVDDPLPTLSPAWAAVSGVNLVDGFTSWFTSGFGRMAILSGSLDIQRASAVDPSCSSYVAALYDQYYAYSSTPVRATANAARASQRTAVQEFAGSEEAQALMQFDPLMYSWVYSQVASGLSMETSTALARMDPGTWEQHMADRSAEEKLRDARHYKVATVSQLWQRAFLGSWTSAQFGDQDAGARMYCHLLEGNADISPYERKAIADVATKYAYVSVDGVPTKGDGYEGISLGAFESGESKSEREQRLLAWAACYRVPGQGWKADPGFASLVGRTVDQMSETCTRYFIQDPTVMDSAQNAIARYLDEGIKAFGNDNCGGWGFVVDVVSGNCAKRIWNSTVGNVGLIGRFVNTKNVADAAGDAVADAVESDSVDREGAIKPLEFDDEEAVWTAVADATAIECEGSAEECSFQAIAYFQDAKEAGKTIIALKGYHPSHRLAMALMGFATSLVYVYAIGFLALGSFIAKFGLILLIILLPVSLMLLAVPSATSGRNQTGVKMLRLTAGFIMSHGLLSFVLGLLLSVILLLESLIGGSQGSVIHAAIPLAALFIVKKLLQAAGLGDLTSMQGSLGMPLSAATSAAGKDWQSKTMDKFNKSTGGQKYDPKTGQWKNRGLTRFDSLAKNSAKRAALFAPRTGAKAAKWGGRQMSDRLALPERKTQLLGRKDAKGNVVEYGLAQRMKSLAGMMDMSKNAPWVAGRAARRLANTTTGKKFDSFARSNRFARSIGNSEAAKSQMEQRRKAIQAISGKSREQRATAREALADQFAEEVRTNQLALRDKDGNIIRDASGKAVFGYRYAKAVQAQGGGDLVDDQGRTVFALQDALTGKRTITADMLESAKHPDVQRDDSGGAIHRRVLQADGSRSFGEVYGYKIDDGESIRVIGHDEFKQLDSDAQRQAVPIGADVAASYPALGVRYVYDKTAGASIIDHRELNAMDAAERQAAIDSGRLHTITDLKDGKPFFSDDELIESARRFSEQFQLRPGQAVFSAVGFDGIIKPVLGDANGHNRFVITKNGEHSEDLARLYRIQYLANHQKGRPVGLTDDQESARLHMIENYLGGYDAEMRKTDVIMDELGYDSNSAHGREQIQLALSGKPSELDKIHYEIPAEVYQAMVAAASGYSPRGAKAAIFKDIADERNSTVSLVQYELQQEQARVAEATVDLETTQVAIRTTAPKLKAVKSNIQRHYEIELEIEESGEYRDALTEEIRSLEATANMARKSSDVQVKASVGSIIDDIKAKVAQRDGLDAELRKLRDAFEDSARKMASWSQEEEDLIRDLGNLAEKVSRTSVEVFSSSKRAEELGKQLEFAFKAFRRDKGKEDWSVVDDAIDDWIKGHNNKWAADGRDLRALEDAFRSAVDAGEEVSMRKAYDELSGVLTKLGRTASRASATGAAYHGHLINELSKFEGNMRHVVETNPSVLPFTGVNFEDDDYSWQPHWR
jgi:hypothetical protein